jgi:hypothetical protein
MDINDQGELKEKDFIQDDRARPPPSYWLVFWIVIGVVGLLWLGTSHFLGQVDWNVKDKPFLQVTNRDFSLFLWQNTEYMKVNRGDKTGYLPGFNSGQNVTPKPEMADQYVVAPPEIIFLYHNWKRLVGNDFISRPIPLSEFLEFLSYDAEWMPRNWSAAPKDYRDMMANIDKQPKEGVTQLPLPVKMAFIGWKNYYKEGEQINAFNPTYADVKSFIDVYPGYARPHWRNIDPNYLLSLDTADPKSTVSQKELPSFLRVALYNFKHGK